MSGPIIASTWVFIQSSTGVVTLIYPQRILETENDTQILLNVSQGTWMKTTWRTFPATEKRVFNLSGEWVPHMKNGNLKITSTATPTKT